MIIYTSTKFKPKRKSKKPQTGLAHRLKPLPRGDYRPTPIPRERLNHPHLPSAFAEPSSNDFAVTSSTSAELLERELLAKKEAERRKTMIVPLHKSSYIYIGSQKDDQLLRGLNKNSAL